MNKTLLLADDSITIQKVVELIFANENYTIVSANDGEEALAKAREAKPDLILADVFLPKVDGYELCRRLKQDPAIRRIPVLLLVGAFETFDQGRSGQVGADGHLIKPFESQELVSRVKATLEAAETAAAQEEAASQMDTEILEATLLEESQEAEEARAVEEAAEQAMQASEPLADEVSDLLDLVEQETESPSLAEVGQALEETIAAPEESWEETEPAPPAQEEAVAEALEIAVPEPAVEPAPTLDEDTLRRIMEPMVRQMVQEAQPEPSQEIPKEQPTPDEDTLRRIMETMVRQMVEERLPQISRDVSKEVLERIGWEVVPDMAEILITREIERLKAELPSA